MTVDTSTAVSSTDAWTQQVTPQPAAELKFGFVSQVSNSADQAQSYRDNLILVRELEAMGYQSVWFGIRHFHAGEAGLPSPFPFLGAAAAVTSTIQLGTAVVPLLAEDPYRVAEDASVLDHVSGARLQLGLGRGVQYLPNHVFRAFDGDEYDVKVRRLHDALGGARIEGTEHQFWPPNEGLRSRILHGTETAETIRFAASLGDGFMPSRAGHGKLRLEELAELRRGDIQLYRRAFAETWGTERCGRVVAAALMWPARDRGTALEEMSAGLDRWATGTARQQNRIDASLTLEQQLTANNMQFGHPEELVDELAQGLPIGELDEIIIGLSSSAWSVSEGVEKARLLLEEVYPLAQARWSQERKA